MEIKYKPIFIRQFNKLGKDLQEETLEKIDLFKDVSNHEVLRVHKLKGKLIDYYSFSVNYRYRIIFEYSNKKNIVHILSIGDHDIYK